MKIQKGKLVMGGIVLSVVLFIVSYAVVTFGDKEEASLNTSQIPVPELKGVAQEFNGKLEAIEAIEQQQKFNAPSVYQEHLIDTLGFYHADMDSIVKRRLIDSVYALGEKRNERLKKLNALKQKSQRASSRAVATSSKTNPTEENLQKIVQQQKIAAKERALEHQLFFASNPKEEVVFGITDDVIHVRVDGSQVVKKDFRLLMRLTEPAQINGQWFAKNTPVYGFVSFKPNRTMIRIEHIKGNPVRLTAYDIQDGGQGVYIENSFRAEAQQQLLDDVVDDINITGVPQVSGIKQLFRRSNRKVKVRVLDGYRLTLKLKK